jgi:hypothetical protein
MMKRETFAIAAIYVPVKRRAMLDPKKVQEMAESILQVGLQSPILVRQDGQRFVLVEGCIAWRRASNSARKPSSDMSCRPAGINGLVPVLRDGTATHIQSAGISQHARADCGLLTQRERWFDTDGKCVRDHSS